MLKSFTKSDVKNGMVFERRDGIRYLVVGGILMSNKFHSLLSDYDSNLIEKKTQRPNLDIVKVYNIIFNFDSLYAACDLIWERKEIKEVTMAEVEAKFGCKVKIVNG